MNIVLQIHRTLHTLRIHRPRKSHRPTSGNPPYPFPAELWVQIIDECANDREWFQLCKTCWFFFQIAQALLYKDITLNCFQGGKETFGHPLSLFEKSLKNRPDLGPLVHALYVVELYPRTQSPKRELPLLSYLHQLPNLKELRVRGHRFLIDSDLCYAIHSHPHLSAVSFSLCRLENSLVGLSNQQFPQSSISDLQITNLELHHQDRGWVALAPTGLRSLKVSCRALPYRTIETILSGIASAGKNHMLEKLSIEQLPRSIADFLITTPQLRQLEIGRAVDADHPIFSSLPKDAIPLLEHYAGPVELSQLLLRNRPVHTVVLTYNNDRITYIDMFAALHLSSVAVTKLEVLNGYSEWPWLWEVPITIHHLTLTLTKEVFMTQLPALSLLENLHTIHFAMYRPKENMSREEIMEAYQICPSLRQFMMSHERWMMVKPSVWERFVCY